MDDRLMYMLIGALSWVACSALVGWFAGTVIHNSMEDLLAYKGVERRKEPR